MLTFLTGNTNKFREAQAILGQNLQQLDIDLPEIQSLDPLEIIQHKIQTAVTSGGVQGSFFVEDTSLVFHALGQFPGPLIKRVLKHEGALGAYRLLADYDDRTATAPKHYANSKRKSNKISFSVIRWYPIGSNYSFCVHLWNKNSTIMLSACILLGFLYSISYKVYLDDIFPSLFLKNKERVKNFPNSN